MEGRVEEKKGRREGGKEGKKERRLEGKKEERKEKEIKLFQTYVLWPDVSLIDK